MWSLAQTVRSILSKNPGRIPEWEFLKEAKGLAGVGQLVAYEGTQFTMAKHRGIDILKFINAPNLMLHDRIFFAPCFKHLIEKLETWLQLLHAFHDAIVSKSGVFPCSLRIHSPSFINGALDTCTQFSLKVTHPRSKSLLLCPSYSYSHKHIVFES